MVSLDLSIVNVAFPSLRRSFAGTSTATQSWVLSGYSVVFGAPLLGAGRVALRSALDQLVERLGVPDVVVYNAALIQFDSIGELTASRHLQAWAVNVVGAMTTTAHLLPAMAEQGKGTFIMTGRMPVPLPDVASLSLGKAVFAPSPRCSRRSTCPAACTSQRSP